MNRFSGFSEDRRIKNPAEAVLILILVEATSLKRSVNEIRKQNRSGEKSPERALKTVQRRQC
ncbi:MAG: hypothetical protein DMF10_10200 [Verrucomicrobia bacterium]|nr:MAG: hypothetical protein DMF10_10200 [Verrucomicrobiota bacterium]